MSIPLLKLATYDESLGRKFPTNDLTQQIATLINAATYIFDTESIGSIFFEVPANEHESPEDSQAQFLARCVESVKKPLWRPMDYVLQMSSIRNQQVKLTNYEYTDAYNTGVEPIDPGSLIFAIPPYYPLAKALPKAHFFYFGSKTYMHPFIMTMHQRINLMNDVADATAQQAQWNQWGAASPIARALPWTVVSKLWDLLVSLQPVGRCMHKINFAGDSEESDTTYDIIDIGEHYRLKMAVQQ